MFFRFFFFLFFLSSFCFAFESFKVSNVCVRGLLLEKDTVIVLHTIKKYQRDFTLTVPKASFIIKELDNLNFFTYVYLERFKRNLCVILIKNLKVTNIYLKIPHFKKKEILNILKKDVNFNRNFFNLRNVCLFRNIIKYALYIKHFHTIELHVCYKINLHVDSVFFYIYTRKEKKTKFKDTFTKIKYFVFTDVLDVEFKKFKNLNSSLFHFDYKLSTVALLDINIVRFNCFNNGFIFFNVANLQSRPSLDLSFVVVLLAIEKGDRFFTHTIVAKTNCLQQHFYFFYMNFFDRNIQGSVYCREFYIRIRNSIYYNLMCKGFFYNKINFDTFLDTKNRLVNVVFKIFCNKRIVVKELKFKGNLLLRDDVLKKNFKTNTDFWCSSKILNIFSRDLCVKKKIIFKGPCFFTKRRNFFFEWFDLLYYINESKKTEIVGDVVYSFIDGLMFKIHANLPKCVGTGTDVNFIFEKNKILKNYNYVMYNSNFYKEIGFGFKFYYFKKNIYEKFIFFKYNLNTCGCNLFLTLPVLKNELKFYLGYDATSVVCDDMLSLKNISKFFTYEGFILEECYFNLTFKQECLNDKKFPTRGFVQNIKIHLTVPVMSFLNYYKYDHSVNFFRSIVNNYFVFNTKINFGFFNTYTQYTTLPFYKNYFLGGISQLCGYSDNSVGRICCSRVYGIANNKKTYRYYNVGGNLFLTARFALIFSNLTYIFKDNIRIFLFLDYGFIHNTQKTHCSDITHRKNYCKSLGIGVIWDSPFGVPLEFSVGVPIQNLEGFKKQLFTITFYKY